MLNSARRIVRLTRWIPLFIKAPIARIAYGFLDDRIFSNTLSNLGVVRLPAGMTEHVEALDVVLDASKTNRASCAMVTFGDTAMLTISKSTADPSFEERLYALLRADGITVSVEGTELHGR